MEELWIYGLLCGMAFISCSATQDQPPPPSRRNSQWGQESEPLQNSLSKLMSFIVPLPKSWLESCKCSDAVEHLCKVPGITRMDFDEGAAHAIWHAHQAMCKCTVENPVGSTGDEKSCARYSGLLTTWICAQFGTHAASESSKLSKSITMKLKCSHPNRIHVFASVAELPRLQTKLVLFKISVVSRAHVCMCL